LTLGLAPFHDRFGCARSVALLGSTCLALGHGFQVGKACWRAASAKTIYQICLRMRHAV
jgi:hypothetical protein